MKIGYRQMKNLLHEENLFRIKQNKELNRKLEITLTCLKAGIAWTEENICFMLDIKGFGYSKVSGLKISVSGYLKILKRIILVWTV